MALNGSDAYSEVVTVWHFITETIGDPAGSGGAVYHPVVYDAAVTLAERAAEVRMTRHGIAEMQGFLFPTDHLLPITPVIGRDCIAMGDYSHCETPGLAQKAGAQVYCFHEVVRPPRLSGGTMVEWVQFTANAIV